MSEKQNHNLNIVPQPGAEKVDLAEFQEARKHLTQAAEQFVVAVESWHSTDTPLISGETVKSGSGESKTRGIALDGALITQASDRMPGIFYRDENGKKIVEFNARENEEDAGRDLTITIDGTAVANTLNPSNMGNNYITIRELSFKDEHVVTEALYIRADGSVKHEQSDNELGSAAKTRPVMSGEELQKVAAYLDDVRESLPAN